MILLFITNLLDSLWHLIVCFFMSIGAGTIFTVFGTLTVMFIGKWVDSSVQKKSKSKDREQIRKLIYLNCENLKNELLAQADIFKEIADSINVDNSAPVPMKSFGIFSHEVIEQMKYETVYDAFHNEIKTDQQTKTFSILWKSITTINNAVSKGADFALDFVKNSNIFQREFETHLSLTATLIGNLMTSVHGTQVSKEAHEFYLGIEKVNKDMQGEDNPPTKINAQYIKPLLDLFNNPANYAIHRNGEIPNLLRKASNDFSNLNNHHVISKKNAEALRQSCNTIAENIKAFLNTFKADKAKVDSKDKIKVSRPQTSGITSL